MHNQCTHFNYGAKYGSQVQPLQTPFGNYQTTKSKVQIFDDYKIKQPMQSNKDKIQSQQYPIMQSSFPSSDARLQLNSLIPKGLNNIANNCYMNAILQMLFCLEQFRTQLFQNDNNKKNQPNKLTICLQQLFHQMRSPQQQNSINPNQFYQLFLQQHQSFTFGRQEDAHEFLLALFSSLGLENLKPADDTNIFDDIKNFFQELFVGNNLNQDDIIEKEWKKKREIESNIVTDLFVGLFSNELTCKSCNFQQINYEEFNVLGLSLECHLGSCSLNELIKFQFKVQTITNYKCSKCTNEEHQLWYISCLSQSKDCKITKDTHYTAQKVQLPQLSYEDQYKYYFSYPKFIINRIMHEEYKKIMLSAKYYSSSFWNMQQWTLLCVISIFKVRTCRYRDSWYRFDDSIVEQVQIEKRQYDTFGTPTPYMLVYEEKQYSQ